MGVAVVFRALLWNGHAAFQSADRWLLVSGRKIAAGLTALLFLAFFLFEIGVVWGMTQTAPDTTVSAAEVPDMVLPSAEAADEKAVDGQTGTATKESLDYVIILGGGVVGEQPSPALEQRILTAYDYLKNPSGDEGHCHRGPGRRPDQ